MCLYSHVPGNSNCTCTAYTHIFNLEKPLQNTLTNVPFSRYLLVMYKTHKQVYGRRHTIGGTGSRLLESVGVNLNGFLQFATLLLQVIALLPHVLHR